MENDIELECGFEYVEEDTTTPCWQREDIESDYTAVTAADIHVRDTFVIDDITVQLKKGSNTQKKNVIRFTNYLDENLHVIMHLLLEQGQITSIKAFLNESIKLNIMQNYMLEVDKP